MNTTVDPNIDSCNGGSFGTAVESQVSAWIYWVQILLDQISHIIVHSAPNYPKTHTRSELYTINTIKIYEQ